MACHKAIQLATYATHNILGLARIPYQVHDEEVLIRAIFYPNHFNKTKIKAAAFRSPANKDEVSVIRQSYVTAAECKLRAKAIESSEQAKGIQKTYIGFALITAKAIRENGSDVVDSRHVFLGHADIVHGFVPKPNEPLPPDVMERLDKLAKAARFVRDPAPDVRYWFGLTIS
jgi:hypothetical protein